MIASTVKPPMAALDTAIKAKDAAAFTKAYADLTAARNHQCRADVIRQISPTPSFPEKCEKGANLPIAPRKPAIKAADCIRPTPAEPDV